MASVDDLFINITMTPLMKQPIPYRVPSDCTIAEMVSILEKNMVRCSINLLMIGSWSGANLLSTNNNIYSHVVRVTSVDESAPPALAMTKLSDSIESVGIINGTRLFAVYKFEPSISSSDVSTSVTNDEIPPISS
jgi:hypothetical protein